MGFKGLIQHDKSLKTLTFERKARMCSTRSWLLNSANALILWQSRATIKAFPQNCSLGSV